MPRSLNLPFGALATLALLLASLRPLAAQEPPAPEPFAAPAPSATFRLESPVERASLDLRSPSLRSLYEAIADAFGIRLVFDPALDTSAPAGALRLSDATLDQALRSAAALSGTFVSPVAESTGIVALDTPAKRAEYERQLLVSFFMDSQTTPQQLTEVTTALRDILDLRRISQDTRTRWITASGRPLQIEAAQQFVQTLQRVPGEVLLEIEVWEINLTRARQLGILPPQTFQLLYLSDLVAAPTGPLVTFVDGGSLYGIRVPPFALYAQFASSVFHSYQKAQLRGVHGQPAHLLVGQRFPIPTTLVRTDEPTTILPNIQYADLGVVLRATPYLHALREVTVQLDVSIRALAGQQISGIPVVANRQTIQQVRLRDGEGYLLGGLLSHQQTASRDGIPLLSRIPVLGYLFGRRGARRVETELLIQIRPHILRPSPAEEFASRAIFFGAEITGLPPPVEIIPGVEEGVPLVPEVEPLPPTFPMPSIPGEPAEPTDEPQPEFLPVPVPLPPGVLPPEPFFPDEPQPLPQQ